MVFSSQIFLFYFLPLTLALYYALPRAARNPFLTLASYAFYGWLHPWFVLLMFASTLIDWYCGKAITATGATAAQRKRGVAISVICNLAFLGFFKYGVFTQINLNRVLELVGADTFSVLHIVLPLGISFYTFQSMSYSIDLYRGHARRARSLLDFSCFVALFPQLVAGPIVRYRELAEQIDERPQRGELFAEGVLYFIVGFVKKVVLANTMGQVAGITFGSEAMPAHVAWFGLAAYTLQLYFDFSGYSDMAIGLGRMFGFRLPVNFRSPYRSKSITEFWGRWHISLSTWLRDYLYLPLGGNRKGRVRTYINLFLVMLLGGFWHGAEWQLLIFGALHGGMLAFERSLGKRPAYASWPAAIRNAITMLFFAMTLVLFRAENLPQAGQYLASMFTGCGSEASGAVTAGRVYSGYFLSLIAVSAVVVWAGRETPVVVKRALTSVPLSCALLVGFGLAVLVMFAQAEDPFIYFRF